VGTERVDERVCDCFMKALSLIIFALLCGVASAGERVALVVGCGTYSNMPGRQLLSPAADSEDVAEAFKKMGYRLIGGGAKKELSREKLTEAIEALTNAAKGAEAAVFYFSGHGVQIGEDNYLLPVDMPKITGLAQMKGRAVSLRESVMVGLEESRVETKVVVLDCCRDNPFSTQLEAAMAAVGKSVRTKGVGEMSGYGSGFYLAFATSPGREALDGNGKRNSPFTGAFLKSLPSAGVEDIDLFFREVKKQMPKDQVSWTNNSLEKKFYLKRDSSVPRQTASVNEPPAPSAAVLEASTSERVAPSMVMVKGGRLPQGSELAGQEVKDFQIGKYEVTWGEWKAVRAWAVTKGYDLAGVGKTFPENGADSLPMVNVSWYDVVKWCNARSEKEGKTAVYEANGVVYRSGEFGVDDSSAVTMKSGANGYRLPLEKEWEWAARGGVSSNGYTYSGSDVVGDVAWIFSNSGKRADELEAWKANRLGLSNIVGGRKANELGLYDMSGNVWEWVWDAGHCYWNDELKLLPGRRIRGGSYVCISVSAEVTFRDNSQKATYRNRDVGFRVAFSSVR
jgi:sulfatase modifying factor 1